jgi:hypothetical protein
MPWRWVIRRCKFADGLNNEEPKWKDVYFKNAGVGLAAGAVAAPAIAQSQPEIKWRWLPVFRRA